MQKMEKEEDYENRNFWEAWLELCVLNMFENIKSLQMESESLSFLKKEKEDPYLYQVSSDKDLMLSSGRDVFKSIDFDDTISNLTVEEKNQNEDFIKHKLAEARKNRLTEDKKNINFLN